MTKLNRSFFNRETTEVAKNLLGKYLIKGDFVGQINEVEAYVGGGIDPACHAHNGITKRTKVMFGPAGYSYVYLIYGMYHCFNVVTEEEGNGSAVLIRGLKAISGFKSEPKLDGPGKLCKTLDINMENNKIDLCSSKDFYIQDRGFQIPEIKSSKRIGLSKGLEHEWRFYY